MLVFVNKIFRDVIMNNSIKYLIECDYKDNVI